MNRVLILAGAATLAAGKLCAQQADTLQSKHRVVSPPIPVEVVATGKGVVFQMTVSRHFSSKTRFGFFNVTNFIGDYATTAQHNEYLSQAFVTVDIWKGFAVNAGGAMQSVTGFRPSAGIQYVYASQRILALVLPRFDLTQTHNFETFALLEYKPKFSPQWGLYTRAQGLYNYNSDLGFHERSYAWLRVGVSYKQYAFGLGANFDFYGPAKVNQNSFGGFVRAELF